MSISSINARTSSLMMSQQLLSRLRQTQLSLLDAQKQITTGKLVSAPSDDPARASSILYLKGALAERKQTDRNLQHALSHLNNIDAALGDASDIVLEAKTVALSQIGVGSDAETRNAQALVVDAQLDAIINLANRQVNGLPLFAGTTGDLGRTQLFEEFLGGVRYHGSRTSLAGDVGGVNDQVFTSNGVDAFGALSTRVKGTVDLDPQASAGVRIADIDGTSGRGVTKGQISVSVNGTQVTVDLTDADSLGDVVTRVNDAIDSVSPGAGSLALSGESFELTGVGANTVTISDIGSGRTAEDFGLELTSTGGAAATGDELNIRLTERTRLADLGASVNWFSGLSIQQGDESINVGFLTLTTIGQVINQIDALGLGLRLEINAEADGLDMVSEVSGIAMSIGEFNGSTATDLGIRTYSAQTLLSDFRDGQGIEPDPDGEDIQFQLHDGTTFEVDASGLTSAQDLIDAIESAATGAGLTVGVDFSVGFKPVGNGLRFTDNTAGAGDFAVTNYGESLVATQLGIVSNAGAGATIDTEDTATVRAHNIFTNLIDLREALGNDSESGITLAGGRFDDDIDSLARARAIVGVEARRVQDQQQRSEEMKISEKALLSEIQDADLTEVITRFSQLQTQLQASLQTAAASLQLSLMDFLR